MTLKERRERLSRGSLGFMLSKMEIVIRKARKGDGQQVAEVANYNLDSGFNVYAGYNSSRDKDWVKKANKSYSENKQNEFVMVAIDKVTRKIVGFSKFYGGKGRLRHRGDIGWSVHRNYAGKGIGTMLLKAVLYEAKKRGFKKAQAEAAIDNAASIKIAEKCGFTLEGKIKSGILLDNGKYMDTYLFGKFLK